MTPKRVDIIFSEFDAMKMMLKPVDTGIIFGIDALDTILKEYKDGSCLSFSQADYFVSNMLTNLVRLSIPKDLNTEYIHVKKHCNQASVDEINSWFELLGIKWYFTLEKFDGDAEYLMAHKSINPLFNVIDNQSLAPIRKELDQLSEELRTLMRLTTLPR